MKGINGKYLRPYLSISMTSISFVGDVAGLFVIVGDHVGSDDGTIDKVGLDEGFIDKDGSNDALGLYEGLVDDDGDSDGVIDENSDGCVLGSLEILMYVQYGSINSLHALIVIAPNPFSWKQ